MICLTTLPVASVRQTTFHTYTKQQIELQFLLSSPWPQRPQRLWGATEPGRLFIRSKTTGE